MIALLLAIACAEPAVHPRDACEAEDRACCDNSDCGEDEICHFVYACYTQNGQEVCDEPVGDRQCHELCVGADEFQCADASQTCQQVEFVQGGDQVGSETACF
ncbi:MAG: hypothetical protein VX899_19960 [Myxococcota bacterium]|nr:hypothetical protein [Myxococcota bacterium]